MKHDAVLTAVEIAECLPESAIPANKGDRLAFTLTVDELGQFASAAFAKLAKKAQPVAFNGWYCAHCQRGVDANEVTYHEQHEVCGRVITNDTPPPDPSVLLEAASPDDLRAEGWAVAVHNDYRLHGKPHTFWLFTKDGRAVKGEGETDAEALNQIRAAIDAHKK